VDLDSEVRVRFSTVVVEVVGLWGRVGSGDMAYWEARRDEGGPLCRQRSLTTCNVSFIAGSFPP
jgi:hypothetical protein